ncbi:MAG: hypothetical protein ILP18_09680 [Treponema sp.]|nr:hypothetical protein [Treponema sp.]
MIAVLELFCYLFFTSAVFVYGLGMNRAFTISEHPRKLFNDVLKMLLSISSSTAISFLVASKILLPVHLTEAYPLVAVLVFSTISIFIESVVRITTKKSSAEYTASILSVLLGVGEGSSVLDAVMISCMCVFSFLAAILILYMLRKKFANKAGLVLISISIILVVLHFWNVSWFACFGRLK